MKLLGSICTAADVRQVFALEDDELTDSTILSRSTRTDNAVKQQIPEYRTIYDNEGTEPDTFAKLVDYVIYTAAAKVLPPLAITLEQKVKDDSGAEGHRYSDIKEYLASIKKDIDAYLDELKADLNQTASRPTLTVMGRSTPVIDIVTGQEPQ